MARFVTVLVVAVVFACCEPCRSGQVPMTDCKVQDLESAYLGCPTRTETWCIQQEGALSITEGTESWMEDRSRGNRCGACTSAPWTVTTSVTTASSLTTTITGGIEIDGGTFWVGVKGKLESAMEEGHTVSMTTSHSWTETLGPCQWMEVYSRHKVCAGRRAQQSCTEQVQGKFLCEDDVIIIAGGDVHTYVMTCQTTGGGMAVKSTSESCPLGPYPCPAPPL